MNREDFFNALFKVFFYAGIFIILGMLISCRSVDKNKNTLKTEIYTEDLFISKDSLEIVKNTFKTQLDSLTEVTKQRDSIYIIKYEVIEKEVEKLVEVKSIEANSKYRVYREYYETGNLKIEEEVTEEFSKTIEDKNREINKLNQEKQELYNQIQELQISLENKREIIEKDEEKISEKKEQLLHTKEELDLLLKEKEAHIRNEYISTIKFIGIILTILIILFYIIRRLRKRFLFK